MATLAPAAGQPPVIRRVLLVPWGDIIEDFLDPLGLTLTDFAEQMSEGWLFGYVKALQATGIAGAIVCVSSSLKTTERLQHRASGITIWALPQAASHRLARACIGDARGRTWVGSRLKRSLTSAVQYRATPLDLFFRVVQAEQADAILIQEYEHPRFDQLTRFGRRMHIPVFATFQGGEQTFSGLETLLRRRRIDQASGLIIPSASERDRVADRYPGIKRRIAGIPNPVDTQLWRPGDRHTLRRELDIPAGWQIVIWHGRIDIWRKGIDVLLQAWQILIEQTGHPERHLFLIGSGQDDDRLKQLLAAQNLPHVHWFSSYITSREKIRRLLSAADVYVSASRLEGMPVAPLEAMACKLPVVATDAKGLTDIIGAGGDTGGIIVARENPAALAAALAGLLADPRRRQRMAEQARRHIETQFSLTVVGEQLKTFLELNHPYKS